MAHEATQKDRPSGSRHGNGNGNGNGNGHGPHEGGGWVQNGGEQIRDILHVVFKRKRLIGVLFLAIALPGLIVTALQRPSYTASAKVMISTQRLDPTVQPTDVTKLDNIQLNETLVNSEVHIISSRDLLERVVRVLATANDGNGVVHTNSPTRSFGVQVLQLSNSLGITPIKASNVIQIDYKASDPMLATQTVNRVVDEYLAYHAAVHGNKGLPRFYDEQLRTLERNLRKAEDSLLTYSDN